MTALGLGAVVVAAAGGGGGLEWRDALTALVGLATAWVGITTARTSRKNNRDTIESGAYARADKINDGAMRRLEDEVHRLSTKSAELEKRADKAEARVDQLLDYIRNMDRVPPPELP